MSRRASGTGTIYQRADGRFEGATYVTTRDGRRRRVRCYAPTKRECERLLRKLIDREEAGMPAAEGWLLADYLHEWLRTTAQARLAPKTVELYSRVVEHYLVPRLGKQRLARLGVRTVQAALDQAAIDGVTVRMVAEMKKVLSAALTQAQREELIDRNPTRLTRIAPYQPAEVIPWTRRQIGIFLEAARTDHYYAAFVIVILYGLRRGEVVGLRWEDIDQERGVIRVRQQLQSVGGQLLIGPLKTRASVRDLPLVPLAERVLARQHLQSGHSPYVFVTEGGGPVPPHSLGDAFQRIRRRAELPQNRLHDLRHGTATMLKSLGVPVRDAQRILGHASPITTQTIYQHTSDADQRAAMAGVEEVVLGLTDGSRQSSRQRKQRRRFIRALQGSNGGPGGTRTHDTLLKRNPIDTVPGDLTEAMLSAWAGYFARVLGAAAVIGSRADESFPGLP